MNLEVWYSLSNTKITDLERLEDVIASLPYKQKIKLLFKPFVETKCPHQKAAYILLKWAEKEYMGLEVLKKILSLRNLEKTEMELMAANLGLCSPQIKDIFEGDDYKLDLKIDFIESKDFLIHQTTLMIGEDNVIDASLSSETIRHFIDDAYHNKGKKIKACSKVSFCSDEQCQFHKQGVQEVKCK
ncbi:MAG TPA: hypothetical protein VJZ48_01590 [Bacilli bacterium]|nr:hypothetical protein [Bacilli bacterium]